MNLRAPHAPAEAVEVMRRWARHALDHGCVLPAEIEPVQTRLIRVVGRAELPGVGPVFVKWMSFPRRRDRIRYWLRALPLEHEASMLEHARAAGLVTPPVVGTAGVRGAAGAPRLSMLVTGALRAGGELQSAEVARAAAALAAAGLFAPDLHPGNFLGTADQGVAVLDLQSARVKRPVGRRHRLLMAAKLLSERPGDGAALVEAGLIGAADRGAAEQRAVAIRAAGPLRRIRRCLSESSEFAVERSWRGVTYRRRAAIGAGGWVEGDAELLRYWIGDRALEVLDGRAPSLAALFRKSWWLPGRHSVKINAADIAGASNLEGAVLSDGYERFQALMRGGSPGAVEGRGGSQC